MQTSTQWLVEMAVGEHDGKARAGGRLHNPDELAHVPPDPTTSDIEYVTHRSAWVEQ